LLRSVTLLGVNRSGVCPKRKRLISGAGKKNVSAAMVKSLTDLDKTFVDSGHESDIYRNIMMINFDGYTGVHVVVEMAVVFEHGSEFVHVVSTAPLLNWLAAPTQMRSVERSILIL